MNPIIKIIVLLLISFTLSQCSSIKGLKGKNKPYEYGRAPKTYSEIIDDYETYNSLAGCVQGETIASIGAGNGAKEIQISCFVEGITWYLEEIDSGRVYQFDKVLDYHEHLKGSPVNAKFNLVLGNEKSTTLPKGVFDRVLMINVFHEINTREQIMLEIHALLKSQGELVIMERMAKKEGEVHGDCNFPKLYELEFLKEMDNYGFTLIKSILGEKVSSLFYYTFQSTQ